MKNLLLIVILTLFAFQLVAQDNLMSQLKKIDYSEPKEYEIGGVTISGIKYLDQNVLLYLTGLEIGQKIMIPGEKITSAIEKLWEQGLFSDVKITMAKVIDDRVFLDIYLAERPRLSRFSFTGVKKSEADGADSTASSIPKDTTISSANNIFFIIFPPYYVRIIRLNISWVLLPKQFHFEAKNTSCPRQPPRAVCL